MRVDDWEMSELIVMAASRFWAPLFFLTFASSLKPKWSTGSLGSSRSNCTKHLAMFREFSRTKSWNICFSFHQRGLPQFTMMLLLGGDVELTPGDKWKLDKVITDKSKRNSKECNSWFHSKCCCISIAMYEILAYPMCSSICPGDLPSMWLAEPVGFLLRQFHWFPKLLKLLLTTECFSSYSRTDRYSQ